MVTVVVGGPLRLETCAELMTAWPQQPAETRAAPPVPSVMLQLLSSVKLASEVLHSAAPILVVRIW